MEAENQNNAPNPSIDQIIYAWNYISWGGAQMYFLGLIKEASKYFKITVLMPEGSDEQLVSFFREEGVECVFFAPSFDPKGGSGLFARMRLHYDKMVSEAAMLSALREKFDLERSIVHVELAPWQSLLSLIRLLARSRVFVTMHNSLPRVNPVRRMLWTVKLRLVSGFQRFNAFASNKDAKRFFKGYFSTRMHDRILVTYTNVNPLEIDAAFEEEVDAPQLKRHYDLPEDRFLIFCVGQFIDRKGRWTFLEAARTLCVKRRDLHFVWISNTVISNADEDRIRSYEIDDRFSLIDSDELGPEHIDLFKFVRLADVFALPSLLEGLPISLLEAMALGIPSISTRVNAIPEAIHDGETGLLVEPGDAEGLAAAIEKLVADKELRTKFATQGRARVLSEFNEIKVAKIAVDAYFRATYGAQE